MEPFIKDKEDSGLTFMGNGIPEPASTPPPDFSLRNAPNGHLTF